MPSSDRARCPAKRSTTQTERNVMSTNVMEASGLGKRYGGIWALRECTLAVPAGYVTALVGPNGAGKSTLLNMAGGPATPSAGGGTGAAGRPPALAPAPAGVAVAP